MKQKIWAYLSFLLIIVMAVGLCFGSTPLSVSQITAALLGRGDSAVRLIILQLRLPRVLAGVLAGAGLSAAGVLLQTVTANDLASPNVVGINSGAGLAVIVMLTLFPTASRWLSVGAFLGAFAAAGVILAAGRSVGSSRSGVVLIGIAVTTLLNAVISFLSLLDEGVLAEYNYFTVGSLKAVRLEALGIPWVIVTAATLWAMVLAQRLDVLSLGDAAAAALGIRVKGLRIGAMALAAACAAAVVSFAGLLGFVGLIVPHIARRLVGQKTALLIPASMLLGGILVVLADLLGRTLFAPSELPVGILMSLIGGPYFLFLLLRRASYAEN